MLLDENGKEIGTVARGFLRDGQNLLWDGDFIKAKTHDDQQSYLRFILELSVFDNKEIAGVFVNLRDGVPDLVISPYHNSSAVRSYISFKALGVGKFNPSTGIWSSLDGEQQFGILSTFHTHPRVSGNPNPSDDDIQVSQDFNLKMWILTNRFSGTLVYPNTYREPVIFSGNSNKRFDGRKVSPFD